MPVRTLAIEGMTCQHCVKAVTNALKSVAGVKQVKVSLEEGNAVLEVDESLYSEQAARRAVAEEGYTVR